MDFITIPQRIFEMGSPEEDPDALYMETPQCEIMVSPFEIKEEPVSNQEWLDFLNKSGYKGRGHNYLTEWQKKGDSIDPNSPVTFVCHEDVLAYCKFYGLKLPTEAQWESASGYMGDRIMGLWQWCRDSWDEWYFEQLKDLQNEQQVRVNDPLIEAPNINKVHLLKQSQAGLFQYLSSFGVVRGCGEEWLRFDRSFRFPLKPTPQRRAQTPLIARHHCIGFRPVYEKSETVQSIVSSWEEVLFSE